MAGDWIAWVKGLAKRREVIVMSGVLNLPRREIAVCCMEWWEWCDSEGDFDPSRDCHVSGVTFVTGLSLIDEHVGVTGFGQAMADVGWARPNDDGDLMHPSLGKWTGSTAKERLRANDRQQKRRSVSRKKSRSDRDKSVTREEKRRGSCTNVQEQSFDALKVEISESLRTAEFLAAWTDWCQHRREIRKKLTPTSVARQLKALVAIGPERAVAAIEHTIEKGWTGIREPEKPANNSPKPDTYSGSSRRLA